MKPDNRSVPQLTRRSSRGTLAAEVEGAPWDKLDPGKATFWGGAMNYIRSHRIYEDLGDLGGKDLLAYVAYPSPTRVKTRPQYAFEGNEIREITADAFPNTGIFPLTVGKGSSDELQQKFGSIVILCINRPDDVRDNNKFPLQERERYNGLTIPPSEQRGLVQTEFKSFAKSPLSTGLTQVVHLVEKGIDFSARLDTTVHLAQYGASPLTHQVMVVQREGGQDYLYGPFEASRIPGEQGGFRLTASADSDRTIIRAAKGRAHLLDVLDNEGAVFASFVDTGEVKDLMADGSTTRFDWVEDDELIEAMGRIARSVVGFSRTDTRELKSALQTVSDAEAKLLVTPERRQRMQEIIDHASSWANLGEDERSQAIATADAGMLADFVLSDEHFSTFFDHVMEDQRIAGRVDEQRANLTSELGELEEKVSAARTELRDLRQDRQRLEDEQRERLERETREATEQVASLTLARDGLSAEVAELSEQYIIVKDKVRQVVRRMSDESTVAENILESSMIQQIVDALGGSAAAEHTRNATTGATGSDAPADSPTAAFGPVPTISAEGMSAQEVNDLICERMSEVSGREYTPNEVANLMVCLTQGYVTTLSGLPGTGKTSTANALAWALGIRGGATERFCQVSVKRGWTSYKDLVGYFNPLSGQMVQSSPELFSLLEAADAEALTANEASAPWLVLLDEANLSSIEHYWSPFLGACDSFKTRPARISLGDGRSLRTSSSLRFLATVNFDHTTEELSPRFLDRSWVITLEPSAMDMDDLGVAPESEEKAPEAISAEALRLAYGPAVGQEVSEAYRAKLRDVTRVFQNHHMPVSPRSYQMMARYVAAADRVMATNTAEASYMPVDLAVLQKVLPQVQGPEDRIAPLVDDLLSIPGLPLTGARLERMREEGERSGFYQFFA